MTWADGIGSIAPLLKSDSKYSPPFDTHTNNKETADEILKSFILPSELGEIKSSFQGPQDGVFIHIQDVHSNEQAQRHIAGILESLVSKKQLHTIILEGTEGRLYPELFSFFPDVAVRRKVADYYLKEGRLTGAEYFAIVQKPRVSLFGAESKELYEKDRDAYMKVSALRERDKYLLEGTEKILKDVSRFVFSEPLQEFYRHRENFKANQKDLSGYLNYLVRAAVQSGIGRKKYPGIAKLHKLFMLDSKIDYEQARKDLKPLLHEFEQSLDQKKRQEFLQMTASFQTKKMGSAKYYGFVQRQIMPLPEAGRWRVKYHDAFDYMRYLEFYDGIGARFLSEVSGLENEIKQKLLRSSEEKNVDRLRQIFEIYQNGFKLSLTPGDMDFFYKNRGLSLKDFGSVLQPVLIRHHFSYGLPQGLEDLERDFKSVCEFYELAGQRDKILVRNAVGLMKQRRQKIVVLITGGFHTPGIEEYLKEQGLSYLVMAPKIEQIDDGQVERYEKAMHQEPMPLEKFFAETIAVSGEKMQDPAFQLVPWLLLPPQAQAGASLENPAYFQAASFFSQLFYMSVFEHRGIEETLGSISKNVAAFSKDDQSFLKQKIRQLSGLAYREKGRLQQLYMMDDAANDTYTILEKAPKNVRSEIAAHFHTRRKPKDSGSILMDEDRLSMINGVPGDFLIDRDEILKEIQNHSRAELRNISYENRIGTLLYKAQEQKIAKVEFTIHDPVDGFSLTVEEFKVLLKNYLPRLTNGSPNLKPFSKEDNSGPKSFFAKSEGKDLRIRFKPSPSKEADFEIYLPEKPELSLVDGVILYLQKNNSPDLALDNGVIPFKKKESVSKPADPKATVISVSNEMLHAYLAALVSGAFMGKKTAGDIPVFESKRSHDISIFKNQAELAAFLRETFNLRQSKKWIPEDSLEEDPWRGPVNLARLNNLSNYENEWGFYHLLADLMLAQSKRLWEFQSEKATDKNPLTKAFFEWFSTGLVSKQMGWKSPVVSSETFFKVLGLIQKDSEGKYQGPEGLRRLSAETGIMEAKLFGQISGMRLNERKISEVLKWPGKSERETAGLEEKSSAHKMSTVRSEFRAEKNEMAVAVSKPKFKKAKRSPWDIDRVTKALREIAIAKINGEPATRLSIEHIPQVLELIRSGEVKPAGEELDVIALDSKGSEVEIGRIDTAIAQLYFGRDGQVFQKIDQAGYEKTGAQQLLHRMVRILASTSDGRYVMIRDFHKREDKRTWGVAGGHVPAGMTYELARNKEMKEELGLPRDFVLDPARFRQIGFMDMEGPSWKRKRTVVFLYDLSKEEEERLVAEQKRLRSLFENLGEKFYKKYLKSLQRGENGSPTGLGEVWEIAFIDPSNMQQLPANKMVFSQTFRSLLAYEPIKKIIFPERQTEIPVSSEAPSLLTHSFWRHVVRGINSVGWLGIFASAFYFLNWHSHQVLNLFSPGMRVLSEAFALSGLVLYASRFPIVKQLAINGVGTAAIFTFFRFMAEDIQAIWRDSMQVMLGITLYLFVDFSGVLISKVLFPAGKIVSLKDKMKSSMAAAIAYAVVGGYFLNYVYIPFLAEHIIGATARVTFSLGLFAWFTIIPLEIFQAAATGEGKNLTKNIFKNFQDTARLYPVFFLYFFFIAWGGWYLSATTLNMILIMAAANFIWTAFFQTAVRKIFIKKEIAPKELLTLLFDEQGKSNEYGKAFEEILNSGRALISFSLQDEQGISEQALKEHVKTLPDDDRLVVAAFAVKMPDTKDYKGRTDYRLVVAPSSKIKKDINLLWKGPLMPEHYADYKFLSDFSHFQKIFISNRQLEVVHFATLSVSPALRQKKITGGLYEKRAALLEEKFSGVIASSVSLRKDGPIPYLWRKYYNAKAPATIEDWRYKLMAITEEGPYRFPDLPLKKDGSIALVGIIGARQPAARSEMRGALVENKRTPQHQDALLAGQSLELRKIGEDERRQAAVVAGLGAIGQMTSDAEIESLLPLGRKRDDFDHILAGVLDQMTAETAKIKWGREIGRPDSSPGYFVFEYQPEYHTLDLVYDLVLKMPRGMRFVITMDSAASIPMRQKGYAQFAALSKKIGQGRLLVPKFDMSGWSLEKFLSKRISELGLKGADILRIDETHMPAELLNKKYLEPVYLRASNLASMIVAGGKQVIAGARTLKLVEIFASARALEQSA